MISANLRIVLSVGKGNKRLFVVSKGDKHTLSPNHEFADVFDSITQANETALMIAHREGHKCFVTYLYKSFNSWH